MADVPQKVAEAGVQDWYAGLSDMDRVKLNRYLDKADASSVFDFFMSLIKAAEADENYRFGVTLCIATSSLPFDAYQRFLVNEEFIDVLTERSLYDDAKNVCEINLSLFPQIRSDLERDNGGRLPERLAFRNRYIDIIVGVESQYEKAYEMLDRYHEMGLIDDDDLQYRRNSLKVHRMQRAFDGIYTYRPKGETESFGNRYTK